MHESPWPRLISAIPPGKFLQQQKHGKQTHTQLNGKSTNPVNNYGRHNDRPYVVTHSSTRNGEIPSSQEQLWTGTGLKTMQYKLTV